MCVQRLKKVSREERKKNVPKNGLSPSANNHPQTFYFPAANTKPKLREVNCLFYDALRRKLRRAGHSFEVSDPKLRTRNSATANNQRPLEHTLPLPYVEQNM